MQGRGAIKDVLKIAYQCTYDEANKITKDIPDESAISDQLQQMKEAGEEPSIIKWALINDPDSFKDYCRIENNRLVGPYSKAFAQAIRLEGTKIQKGKHAAGMIISQESLANICPMVYDENSNSYVAGVEMEGLEAMGHIKFDLLAVSTIDRIMTTKSLIKERFQYYVDKVSGSN
jgi:DNA polymerase-3 subunit alpha